MLDDKKIKEYKIKLTSKEILDTYQESLIKNKSKKKSFLPFVYSLTGVLSVGVISLIIYRNIDFGSDVTPNPSINVSYNSIFQGGSEPNVENPPSTFEVVKTKKEQNRLGFSLVSSSFLLKSEENLNNKANIKMKNDNKHDSEEEDDSYNSNIEISEKEFIDVVDKYEMVNDLVYEEIYPHMNKDIEIAEAINETSTRTYNYEIITNNENTKIYIDYLSKNNKENFVGEMQNDNGTYYFEGSIKEGMNSHKRECEVKLYYDQKNYIVMEEEYVNDQIEYQYKKIENGKEVFEFEFEKEEDSDIEMELFVDKNTYEYKVEDSKSENWKVFYQKNNLKGRFELIRDGENSKYIDENTKIEVIK